jgi:spermidine/putrescine-binding protein
MGIVYDATKLSPEEASSLTVLWDKKWAGHIVMQSLELVLYGTAAIYVQRNKLEAMSNGYTTYSQDYRDSVQVWITKCDPMTRSAVKKALMDQHALVSKYATGAKLSIHIAGDNEWVGWMRHPEAIGALKFNHNLQFSYAREGSAYSPFLFSITTACKNTELAYEFLRFISRTDVVVHNMRNNSIPGVITEAVELCREEILNDTVQLAGTTLEWRQNFFDLFNMPEDVAKRTPLLIPPPAENIEHLRNTIKEFWEQVGGQPNP